MIYVRINNKIKLILCDTFYISEWKAQIGGLKNVYFTSFLVLYL